MTTTPFFKPRDPTNSTKKEQQQQRRKKVVTFSTVRIIEFPYAVGNTPCSVGVPIGASHEAQHETTLSLDCYEEHRPKRRPKADLHISASDRRALLLKSGHSSREIAAAMRDAMRIRKQRAETLRDLRRKMHSLAVAEQHNAANFDSTLGMSGAISPVRTTCSSPVPMIRSTTQPRSRWTPCRQDQPLQLRRRRLSETRSPMPLKIHTDDNKTNSKPRRPVLSPLRTNIKLSFDASMLDNPNVMSPARRPVHSPVPTPTQRSPFSCLSPKMTRASCRGAGIDENQSRAARTGKWTPTKRPLTPVKNPTGGDRPLSIPKRVRTPPPSCSIRATRMF